MQSVLNGDILNLMVLVITIFQQFLHDCQDKWKCLWSNDSLLPKITKTNNNKNNFRTLMSQDVRMWNNSRGFYWDSGEFDWVGECVGWEGHIAKGLNVIVCRFYCLNILNLILNSALCHETTNGQHILLIQGRSQEHFVDFSSANL